MCKVLSRTHQKSPESQYGRNLFPRKRSCILTVLVNYCVYPNCIFFLFSDRTSRASISPGPCCTTRWNCIQLWWTGTFLSSLVTTVEPLHFNLLSSTPSPSLYINPWSVTCRCVYIDTCRQTQMTAYALRLTHMHSAEIRTQGELCSMCGWTQI